MLRAAARDLFAEHGYRATTREIATRAGVSHDLIFRYFGTKEKLLFDAVLTPLLDAVGGLHRRWAQDPSLHGCDGEELVRRFTIGLYTFMDENRPIARAMVHLFTESSTEGELEHLRQKIGETLAPMVLPMRDHLSAEGMRPSAPALQLRVTMLLVGAVALFLTNTYSSDAEAPLKDEILDELSRFIYNGLQ